MELFTQITKQQESLQEEETYLQSEYLIKSEYLRCLWYSIENE